MNCIVACVTADSYQFYIPTFVYSARRVMPDVKIKIFIQGKLDGSLRPVEGADIEDYFLGYPSCPSILRFLAPDSMYRDFEYIYFTDIDFVFLPHDNKTLFDYHAAIIKKCRSCYSGHRGPMNAKKYKWKRWDGAHSRIAGGAFMATQEWLALTSAARFKVLEDIYKRKGGLKYREEDEVYLYNICKDSHLEVPVRPGFFTCGKPYNITYRDLHLGDFKFDKRWVNRPRMERLFLTNENAAKFAELDANKGWLRAADLASRDPMVRLTLQRARQYVYCCD